MPIHGMSTAIYGTEDKTTISLATLTAKNEKAIIDPTDIQAARNALMTVLDTMCSYRAQLMKIDEHNTAMVPLPVVCGTGEHHPHAVYAQMLRGAFPEYFENDPAVTEGASINSMFEHLLIKHFGTQGPLVADNEYSPLIEVHKYTLFCEITIGCQTSNERCNARINYIYSARCVKTNKWNASAQHLQ